MAAFTLGKTLDNTIYRTSVVHKSWGVPQVDVKSGVDTILGYEIDEQGYQWFVDYNVQSVHLRSGLTQELNHQYWYAKQLPEMWRNISTKTNTRAPPVTKSGVIHALLCHHLRVYLWLTKRVNHPLLMFTL